MRSLLNASLDAARGAMKLLGARRKSSGAAASQPAHPVDRKSYEAIAVRPCHEACEAASALAHQRILVSAAPPELPLPGCTNRNCRCRFEHFTDRRAEDERRHPEGDANDRDDSENRRQPGDRRINRQLTRPTSYFNDY